jgi:VanZ family protein
MPAKINKFNFDNKISRWINLWFPVLICMGLIFYFSSLPGSAIPHLFLFQNVVFHLLAYAALAYFFSRALKNTYAGLRLLKIIFFTVLFGMSYGITDELHQLFVPGRLSSVSDVFMDAVGSFLGSLLYR